MICNRRVPARVKGKVYNMVVRPAMVYEMETVALKKTGRRAGGSRIKDAKISVGSDEDGQN